MNTANGKRSFQGQVTKENVTIHNTMADSVTDEQTGDNMSITNIKNYRSMSQNEENFVNSTVQSALGNQTMEALPNHGGLLTF